MNAPAPLPGVVATLAGKYMMNAQAFEATLRATVFPPEGTREQFAAFCLICNQYDLNPLLKQIYAYLDEKRGVVVIVGIDGWIRILQKHGDYDGVQFEDDQSTSSIVCRIFRKGMTHPTEVREYMSECKRETAQWKRYPSRMLRHKSFIQCIRYAYGISGIVDEDEYERIVETQREEPQVGTQALKKRLAKVVDIPPPDPVPQDGMEEGEIGDPPSVIPSVAQLLEAEGLEGMEISFREELEQAKSVEDVNDAVKQIANHPKVKELREIAAVKIGDLLRKRV